MLPIINKLECSQISNFTHRGLNLDYLKKTAIISPCQGDIIAVFLNSPNLTP